MSAKVHRGAVILVMDHSVITLRNGEGVSAETGFLSIYDISYSPDFGGGRVALVRVPMAGIETVFADRLELGLGMQARLDRRGMHPEFLTAPPVAARIVRRAMVNARLGYTIETDEVLIDASWHNMETPFWAEGPAPAFVATEDMWCTLISARAADILVNGKRTPGDPFDDNVWLPWVGRPISSAHVALGETRVTPITETP